MRGTQIRHSVLGWTLLCAGCATAPVLPEPIRQTAQIQPRPMPTLSGSSYTVRPGETLWRIARSYGLHVGALASANRLPSAARLSPGQQLFIPLPVESNRFVWPVRGSVRSSSPSWVEIAAPAGVLVRASRGGQVAVAARQLSGFGKTIVLEHADGYFTVYAGLSELLVAPRTMVKQGTPIGSIGPASLHFEIRYGVKPYNALALLPVE